MGDMDTTLHLLDMGFTDEEILFAMDNFGPEVPICELADSIFARRIALDCVQEDKDSSEALENNHGLQNQKERSCLVSSTSDHRRSCLSTGIMGVAATSSSNGVADEHRSGFVDGTDSKRSSVLGEVEEDCSDPNSSSEAEEMHKRRRVEAAHARQRTVLSYDKSFMEIGDFSSEPSCLTKPERNIFASDHGGQHLPSKPPFFLFGNVSDGAAPETWRRLSHFLYGIEPEHVNTQFFSAMVRREGYYHNLPRDGRFHILPKPPMTIEGALPHTRRWWPAWDTRKQLGSWVTHHDTAGAARVCDRLEKMMGDCGGMLSTQQQLDALQQCKNLNLVWVGHHRPGTVEPDDMERVLGYPAQHTRMQGLEPKERLAALECCFQTDTLGYHLSVLKNMYPSGLRVLSVFSGIGGAEVALHRLGIRLRCVVSVDAPGAGGEILRRWWKNSGQSGELRQIDGVERLTGRKIESLVEEFGGFDLVVGANPCSWGSLSPGGSVGGRKTFVRMEINPFHEFVRVFKTLKRSLMGRKSSDA